MTGSLRVDGLRCEHLVDPIGIGTTRPRFSWLVHGGGQTSYRVVVTSNGDVMWDTGRVESSQTAYVEYDGAPLTSRQSCQWKVQVDDGPWSDPAEFEVGLLAPADWVASWITTTREDTSARCFRTVFDLPDGEIVKARVYVTALGLYELELNGARPTQDVFRPGWTDYHKRVQYQVYDVAGLLQPGANAVGALLGDGWYSGNIGMGKKKVWGDHPELLLQLEVELADGTRTTVTSNREWKTAPSPITANDLQKGESYDARLEQPGWSTAAFDDSEWTPVMAGGGPVGALSATCSEPVREVMELAAVPTGTPHVYDLGQNMVGWTRIKVRGDAGATVTIRHAEMLNPDGSLYTENLRGADNVDTYTLKGDPAGEVWAPRFTFHGFRYVEVTGAEVDEVAGIVAHSDTPVAGSFECSNPLVNQLVKNIVWGQRGNFLEVPTDCPQRDERLGWMGDAQIFVATATLNMDVAAFFTKWLKDVRDAQLDIGAYPDICPRWGRGNPPAAPAWSDAGIIVPWALYRRYGDVRLIEEHYESMTRWVEFVHRRNPDFRWSNERGNDWGDWVAIGADSPKDVLASMWWAYSTGLLSRMAEVVGRADDAARYAELSESIRQTWCDDYVREDGFIEGDTQTIYALALRFGLLPEHLRKEAAARLLADIESRGTHLSTGFMGIAHLLPALTEVGATDVAYKLLLNETFPSWGYSIRHGATTIWERWDGWTEENGFQTPSMNSFNHYAFGAVGEWIYEVVGGVKVDFSAPTPITIAPQPGEGIDWASAEFQSILGPVACRWEKTDAGFTVEATVPVDAEVVLPLATHRVGPGTHRFEVRES